MTNQQPMIWQNDARFMNTYSDRSKSWTETIQSFQRIAKEYASLILYNEELGVRHRHFVTIYFRSHLPPKEFRDYWTATCRKLRRNELIGLWVVEPSRKNKFHIHMLVTSQHSTNEIKLLLELAMPSREKVKWHKQVKMIDRTQKTPMLILAHYITKARLDVYRDGTLQIDVYRNKRLLFKPNLGITKIGTLRQYWSKPRKEMWQDIKDREFTIAQGLAEPGMYQLVRHIHRMLGGHVSKKRIERNLGKIADKPHVKQQALRHAGKIRS